MEIDTNSLCLLFNIYNIQKTVQNFNSGEYCQARYSENSHSTKINRNTGQNTVSS